MLDLILQNTLAAAAAPYPLLDVLGMRVDFQIVCSSHKISIGSVRCEHITRFVYKLVVKGHVTGVSALCVRSTH